MKSNVRLLTQLPSNGLYEGFVVLSDGSLLVARADEPELYQVDVGANGEDEVRLLSRFQEVPGINGIINICGIPGNDEEFIVLVGLVDLQAVRVSNYQVWRFSLGTPGGGGHSRWEKVTSLDNTGFYLSIATISDRILLVTDSARCRVESIDLATGGAEVLVTHPSFKPATEADFFGINRLCVADEGLVWFTNSSRNVLGRFRVAMPEGKKTAPRLVGEVEIVAERLPACDGFAVLPDGSAAFLVTMHDDKLVRVDLTGREKSARDVGLDLVNPSVVGLIPRPGSKGGGGLQLCVICNGEFEAAWKNHDPNAGWRDIADIVDQVKVTITVTEE
ncbi:hypothetical protein PG985_003348 [Apiospora marii]|uniref:SMP-30/Gluconolactonase/LRE-like region domain-containing protein n=1 Tax=Apiospora marii TaxID=335849 RepID=A0ABR1RVG7_9PEZI